MSHDRPYKGKTITADHVDDLSRAQSYTPELTADSDPDLGEDGTANGWQHRGGHLITAGAFFEFSGTGLDEGSGVYNISLPIDADTSLLETSGGFGGGSIIGGGTVRGDSSTTDWIHVKCQLQNSSEVRLLTDDGDFIAHDTPSTFAEGHQISVFFVYPADPDAL